MVFKIALLLLVAWLLGVLGLYNLGDVAHFVLLVGLMFLLMAFLDARHGVVTRPGK